MFKSFGNLGIGKRIALGFGAVLVILSVLGVWSILGIGGIVENAGEVINGNALKAEMVQREVDHLNWAESLSTTLNDASVSEVTVQLDPTKCAFGKWYGSEARQAAAKMVPEIATLLDAIGEPHKRLHESAQLINDVFVQANPERISELLEIKTAHLIWAARLKDMTITFRPEDVDKIQTDPTKCALGKWLASPECQSLKAEDSDVAGMIEKMTADHRNLHASAISVIDNLKSDSRDEAIAVYRGTTQSALDAVLGGLDGVRERYEEHLFGYQRAQEIYAQDTKPALKEVQDKLHNIVSTVNDNVMTDAQMLSAADSTRLAIILFSGIAILVGISTAFVIGRSTINALKTIMCDLGSSSQQLAIASEQVAQGSEMLASGASEQASSLEEISSSLEEMSAMTRQTAANAKEANKLSSETSDAASVGTKAMDRMNNAIGRIKSSSDETAKIVKTIDEIAFQTNLLALNAAVEAARAGEAGKGFAVVAEEVRNLAQRSAEAAKNTSQLLLEAQQNAESGVKVSDEVASILTQIVERVDKTTTLIREVTEATDEQSSGIEQLNKAVSSMDSVTQQNASSAEESSSASEELSNQALELTDVVRVLAKLCGVDQEHAADHRQLNSGTGNGNGNKSHRSQKQYQLTSGSHQTGNGKAKRRFRPDLLDPEQVIPLDHNDLQDF